MTPATARRKNAHLTQPWCFFGSGQSRGAKQLLALYDGLRLQALLTADTDVVSEFDRAATRMRRGWSEQPRYWDIPVAATQQRAAAGKGGVRGTGRRTADATRAASY